MNDYQVEILKEPTVT